MIPLETSIDPLAFDSWVQIAALMILVSGGITWKWLSSVQNQQKETGETVDQIKRTLTTNNNGSHIKDQLDRIEKVQFEQAKLMAVDSQKLDDHLIWSENYVNETKELLESLPCELKIGRHYFDDDEKTN